MSLCLALPVALLPGGAHAALTPPSPPRPAPQLQREDLAALGSLMLLLACVGRGAPPSLEHLTAYFSREFCHVVAGLLASLEGGRGLPGLQTWGCWPGRRAWPRRPMRTRPPALQLCLEQQSCAAPGAACARFAWLAASRLAPAC